MPSCAPRLLERSLVFAVSAFLGLVEASATSSRRAQGAGTKVLLTFLFGARETYSLWRCSDIARSAFMKTRSIALASLLAGIVAAGGCSMIQKTPEPKEHAA